MNVSDMSDSLKIDGFVWGVYCERKVCVCVRVCVQVYMEGVR